VRFASPTLLLFALLPLGVLVLRYALRRRYWGFTGDVAWSVPLRARSWRHLPEALVLLAGVLLAVALADPRVRRTVVDPQAAGRAMVIVLDLSFSMQEKVGPVPAGMQPGQARPNFGQEDTRPTRMEVVKQALKDFISLRRTDRIGFVVFSENAYVISPLTTDYDYLAHYVDMIDANTLSGEGYTAIGEGVAAATQLLAFEGVKDGQKGVVLVFTDGESNIGRDPVEAVRVMREAGHRGYMIGIDLPEYVTQREAVQRLVNAFVETGGRYYDTKSGASLDDAYRDISAVEADPIRLRSRTVEEPVFHYAAVGCLMLLALAVALRALPPFTQLT
jgi:Ca-activated chloride channel family protein